MTVETWIKESDNEYCKIHSKTFCQSCMNGDHDECLGTKEYSDSYFECQCDCEVKV